MAELSYNEEQIDRRKYIIPLALLMACMLAVVGCAYAYNYTSTLESTNQSLDGCSIEIQYADGQSGTIFQADDISGNNNIVINTHNVMGVTTAYFDDTNATADVKLTITVSAEGEAGQVDLTALISLDTTAWELTNVTVDEVIQSITVTYDGQDVVYDYDTLTDDTATAQVIAEDIASGDYTLTISIQTTESLLLDGKANDDGRLPASVLKENIEKILMKFVFAAESN